MRYPASEKLEIIRLVEQSHLPAKRTLDKLGIPRTNLLPMVRPVFGRWPGGSKGQISQARTRMEPYPR